MLLLSTTLEIVRPAPVMMQMTNVEPDACVVTPAEAIDVAAAVLPLLVTPTAIATAN